MGVREEDDGEEWYEGQGRFYRRDQEPHRGGLILTLGVLALVLAAGNCVAYITWVPGLALGIIAWAMGRTDLREIEDGRLDPDGEGLTRAGWVCGIIGTVLNLIVMLLFCGVVGLLLMMASRR